MQIEHFKYEIDDSNAIRCWNLNNPDELDRPFLYQPVKPDGTAWADRAEAEAWAVEFIQEMLKPAPEIVEVVDAEEAIEPTE